MDNLKKSIILCIMLIVIFFVYYIFKISFYNTNKIDLNYGWTVKIDDVILENQDIFLKSVINNKKFQNKYILFRKTIEIPQNLKDKDLSLSLGGIPFGHEVYVNGHLIGLSPFDNFIFNDWNVRYSYYLPKEFLKNKNDILIKVKSIYEYGANQSIFIAESTEVVKNNHFLNQYFISVYLALSIINLIVSGYFIKLYSINKINKKYLYFAITLIFITIYYSNYYITSSIFNYLFFQKIIFISYYCALFFYVMYLRKNYGYKYDKKLHLFAKICGIIILMSIVLPNNLIDFVAIRKKLYFFVFIAFVYIIYLINDAVIIKKKKGIFNLAIYFIALALIIHDMLIDLNLISRDLINGFHLNSYAVMIILIYGAYDMAKEYNIVYLNSIIDSLTGLFNRRYYDSYISNFIKNQEQYCLLIIDFDEFKKINDIYGHAVGDMVLKRFGKIIKQVVQDKCFAARIGGEEFVIIFERGLCSGEKLAERIRQEVENYDWEKETGCDGIKVTISVGGIYFTGESDFEKAYEAADNNLYSAKSEGKNKVVI